MEKSARETKLLERSDQSDPIGILSSPRDLLPHDENEVVNHAASIQPLLPAELDNLNYPSFLIAIHVDIQRKLSLIIRSQRTHAASKHNSMTIRN